MKISEINEFIQYIKSLKFNKTYISHEFIEWIKNKSKLNEINASEIFELNKIKILKKIIEYINYCNDNDIVSEFLFDPYDDDCLINTKFSFSKEVQNKISTKIEFRNQILNFLKQINWREFEKISSIILKENHIDDVIITQSRNDQGIDFYGYYEFKSEKILPRFYKYLNFRIIGQVKHSEKNKGVDHQKVASFGTEINLLRKAQNNGYFQNLTQEFINSDLPIVGIFITNSYYPQKAKDFAKEYGIIYWNGEQVAEDLCTEKIINSIFDNETNQLSLDLFKQIINNT